MGQELAAQRHPAARLSGPGPGRRQVLAVLPAALLAVLTRPAGVGADEAAPVRIGFLGSWDGELAELREGLREVGASPAGLAVEPAPRFDLAINLKTARALDLKVPLQMQRRAVRLIRP